MTNIWKHTVFILFRLFGFWVGWKIFASKGPELTKNRLEYSFLIGWPIEMSNSEKVTSRLLFGQFQWRRVKILSKCTKAEFENLFFFWKFWKIVGKFFWKYFWNILENFLKKFGNLNFTKISNKFVDFLIF